MNLLLQPVLERPGQAEGQGLELLPPGAGSAPVWFERRLLSRS
ncbi:hypothetical protein [Stenotrophomonas lactitubi]|nr:hypothetical protein [Stenotrophomonas lactitubi]